MLGKNFSALENKERKFSSLISPSAGAGFFLTSDTSVQCTFCIHYTDTQTMGDVIAGRDTRQLQCALGSASFQTPSHGCLAPLQLSRNPPTASLPAHHQPGSSFLTLRGRKNKYFIYLICNLLQSLRLRHSVQHDKKSKALFCSKIFHLL